MKKANVKKIAALLLLCMILMTGCGGQEPEAPSVDYAEAYSEPLSRYYTALSEQWDFSAYMDAGMSTLPEAYYEGNALDNVGYALIDLDFDEVPELVIGAAKDNGEGPILFQAWTLKDGQPVSLFDGHARNRYYLEWSEEGVYIIANEASSSAANSAYHYYTLDGGEMQVVQGIVFDAIADEANPWFLSDDDDWNTGNDTPVDEATAVDIIQSHLNLYMAPDYVLFSAYEAE